MGFEGFNTSPLFDVFDGVTLSNIVRLKEEPRNKSKDYVSSSTLILKTIDILNINKKVKVDKQL